MDQRTQLDLIAHVDGGCFGNPGPSGVGVVIDGAKAGPIRIAKWIGRQDSNVAEYAALLEALHCALWLKACRLHVYSDSQIVVKQMTGEYQCRSPRLYSLNWTCRKLAGSLDFSISHTDREKNTEADGLANFAIRRGLLMNASWPPPHGAFGMQGHTSGRASVAVQTVEV
jgi:ribonuclease HI